LTFSDEVEHDRQFKLDQVVVENLKKETSECDENAADHAPDEEVHLVPFRVGFLMDERVV